MVTTTSTPSNSETISLLERNKALIQAERSLTTTIEKVEPWLSSVVYQKTAANHYMGTLVRPIPRTMEEVEQVLAVGRNFASRTSAPAGWNPAAPLVGFSTPNPLPHQLRGGALAALQLDRARQAESDKKRKRQIEEEEKLAAKKQAEEEAQSEQAKADKERSQQQKQKQQDLEKKQQHARRVSMNQPEATNQVSMNLSDSSSEEESNSEEED